MARYPQGVTSFIPSYQAYQPDFTMMGKMLSIRQNQYDQNWKKLNDVYGSLLYADTTHEQSQDVKDQLKNEIDFNLRRVSGLDLSLEQNVQAAQQVFQPFYENSSLMYDMAATKNINAARAKGDSYKNSADPNMSGLYWNEGMDEINYRVQEFKETPYDQIQGTGLAQVNYTPFFNIGKEAMALAESIGPIKIESTSADGKYDIVTTNGSQITDYLQKLFEINLGGDPRSQARFKTEAYVARKNYMNSEAGNFDGDKLAAERNYLEESYKLLSKTAVKRKEKAQLNSDGIAAQAKIAANPNSEYVPGQEKLMQQLMEQEQVSQQNLKEASTENDMVSAENNQGQQDPFENIDILRRKVDFLTANSLMRKKVGEHAELLAYKDYAQEISLNEEYKINLENELGMQRDMYKKRVDDGTATYKLDSNGKVIGIEDIKGVSDYITVQDPDVTGGETDMRTLIDQNQQSEFSEIQQYLNTGLDIVQTLAIDQISGGQEDILRILDDGKPKFKGKSKWLKKLFEPKIKSTKELRDAISSYEAFKNSGLSWTYLNNVSSNIRKIIFGGSAKGKIDYSTLLDKKYGINTADRQAVTTWHNNALKNRDNIEASIANKNYLKRKTKEILEMGKNSGDELSAAFLAVDANGKGVGATQYWKNVEQYLGKTYISDYLKRQNIDATTEAAIEAKADEYWDKYSWYDPRLYASSVSRYINTSLNFYKLANTKDGIGDYFSPFNWGKYEVGAELRKKWDAPDYGDVIEAFDNKFKDSNLFKDAPPSMRGSGTGTSGMSVMATIKKGASYTKPYQEFYGIGQSNVGIADDIRRMIANPSKTLYSAYGTTKDAQNTEEKNTQAHQDAVKFLLEYVINPANNAEIGDFDISIKPGTQFDGTKAAYQIKLSSEVLNKLIQKSDKSGLSSVGVANADVLNALYKNGLTIISDQVLLDSDAWERGASDPIATTLNYKLQEQRVAGSSENRVSVSDQLGNGFAVDFDLYGDRGDEQFDMRTNVQMFDLNHYLQTGETKSKPVTTTGIDPQSLTQSRSIFISETIPQLKKYNAKMIEQVKAAIATLKAQNPNITNQEIYNALKSIYGTGGI